MALDKKLFFFFLFLNGFFTSQVFPCGSSASSDWCNPALVIVKLLDVVINLSDSVSDPEFIVKYWKVIKVYLFQLSSWSLVSIKRMSSSSAESFSLEMEKKSVFALHVMALCSVNLHTLFSQYTFFTFSMLMRNVKKKKKLKSGLWSRRSDTLSTWCSCVLEITDFSNQKQS